MNSRLLIVVDMLNDFCKEGGALFFPQSLEIIPNVKRLVNLYRKNDMPIIWLADHHAEDDLEFNRFPKHAVAGTTGCQVLDELKPATDIALEMLIPKTRYSGFYGTNLEYMLTKISPDVVEVVGVCTSICVMDTVGGLANRDFAVQINKNCVADFDDGMHAMALKRMETLYGAVVI